MNDEQRKKDNARSFAGVYRRRGLLWPRPCEGCGADNTQMHHEDYDCPLDVIWLCRECHLWLHRFYDERDYSIRLSRILNKHFS